MSFIVEDGTGVPGATSYNETDFVVSYLTDTGRQAEFVALSTAQQQAKTIEGTAYIETRFRTQFLGTRFWSDISQARATLRFNAQPANTETITLGTVTYTYVTGTPTNANEIAIGDFLSDTVGNTVDAIIARPDRAGIGFGTGTVANERAVAQRFIDNTLLALSKIVGTAGNEVAVASTSANVLWNQAAFLAGGSNIVVAQPLSFPRRDLRTRDGVRVDGIPRRLKEAAAEYTWRAVTATLAPDPTRDATGGIVTSVSERVGPIQESKTFLPGTAGTGTLPPYPAADRLLREFVRRGGVVVRG